VDVALPPESEWNRERAGRALGQALAVAVRTNLNNAGNTILKWLVAEPDFYPGFEEMGIVVTECMRTGNIDLLLPTLEYRKTRSGDYDDYTEATYDLPISVDEMNVLFREGGRSGLRELLQRDIIHPDKMGHDMPLDRAVYENRQDLVRILLINGADINAHDNGGQGFSALQHAARRGYLPNVKFLIKTGADPDSVKRSDGDRYFKDNLELCEKAALYAQGAKLDEDTWCRFWQTFSCEQSKGWRQQRTYQASG
jgi:hypothetical protein